MLVYCPDCNKKISDQAKMCPDCGYDMEKRLKEISSNISGRASLLGYLLILPCYVFFFIITSGTIEVVFKDWLGILTGREVRNLVWLVFLLPIIPTGMLTIYLIKREIKNQKPPFEEVKETEQPKTDSVEK